MQDNKISSNKIISNGPQNFRASKTYRDKVDTIKRETELKYQDVIIMERNLIKRLVLQLKMYNEIDLEVKKLDSLEKLYIDAGKK